MIGSTGTHYTVRLSDARRVCNCMDCRIRKRDCKHIRLLLAKLLVGMLWPWPWCLANVLDPQP